MKSKQDIQKQIETAKDQLVAADEKGVPFLQGFIQSLTWAIAEEDKPKEEATTD